MKSTLPKIPENREWLLIDAADKPLGRLAVKVANLLRGKNKPDFTPAVDTGAFVIVINASKVKLSGRKETMKVYTRYTGYRAGLKTATADKIREKDPELLITHAVNGMLPDNNIAVDMMKRLRVFAGAEHTHAAQKPQVIEL